MTRLFNKTNIKSFRSKLRKNSTDAERRLWFHLRGKQLLGVRFLRQFSIDTFIVDFYSPQSRLVIEVDGSQHIENENYDRSRTNYLRSLGIKVIRFWDNEVLTNIDGVLENILTHITPPHLPFDKRGRILTHSPSFFKEGVRGS